MTEVRALLQILSWRCLSSLCKLECWEQLPRIVASTPISSALWSGAVGVPSLADINIHRIYFWALEHSDPEGLIVFTSAQGLFLQFGSSKFIFLIISIACFFILKCALRTKPLWLSTCTLIILVQEAREATLPCSPALSVAPPWTCSHEYLPWQCLSPCNTAGTSHSCLKSWGKL